MELGPILRSMLRNKMGVGLLVVEIAITLAIVLNAYGLVHDNIKRLTIPSGLDEHNMVSVSISCYGEGLDDKAYFHQIIDRDLVALNAMDRVIRAGHVAPTPLQGGGSSTQRKPESGDETTLVRCPRYNVDEGFLDVLGLELYSGRTFNRADQPTLEQMESGMPIQSNVIVTRDLARALFPDGDALGKTITSSDGEIINIIVGTVDYMFTPYDNGRSGMETRIIFFPNRRVSPGFLNYMVRTKPGEAVGIIPQIETNLLNLYPDRIITLEPLMDVKRQGMAFNNLVVKALTLIMAVLVFVTGLGIYGLTSFAVAGRTRQIGTRRALGATRIDIIRYFLVENSLMTMIGVTLGTLLAVLLNRVIVMHAEDVTPLGWQTLAMGILCLWVAGLLSTLLPALRAARVPPVVATRDIITN